MIATADLFVAFKRLWDASALPGLVPGGLWEGPPAQDAGAGSRYAVLTAEEGDPEYFTGGYLWPVTLAVAVWSAAGAADASRYQRALRRLLRRDNAASLFIVGAVVVDVRPVGGDAKTEENTRRDAADVKLTAARWAVLLQGTT